MLRFLAIFLIVSFGDPAFSEESRQGEASDKTKSAQSDDYGSSSPKQITIPANSVAPTIVKIFTGKHSDEENHCAAPKNWKEWWAFSWCKADAWIDTERVIAAFTVILGIATGFLSWATRSLVRSAEKTAASQLRAYVFFKGFKSGPNIDPVSGRITEYLFFAPLENAGLTPATDARVWFELQIYPFNEDREPVQKEVGGAAVIMGPHSTGQQTTFWSIPIDVMSQCFSLDVGIFAIARVEFKDTFDPTIVHHHQQCAIIEINRDPRIIPARDEVSYVTFRLYGPNSSS
jgi:hypothetical protein